MATLGNRLYALVGIHQHIGGFLQLQCPIEKQRILVDISRNQIVELYHAHAIACTDSLVNLVVHIVVVDKWFEVYKSVNKLVVQRG